jgi:hypothetical protein
MDAWHCEIMQAVELQRAICCVGNLLLISKAWFAEVAVSIRGKHEEIKLSDG